MASLAAASVSTLKNLMVSGQSAEEAARSLSYTIQLLWMHRLPAYRTRFQHISSSALQNSNKVGFEHTMLPYVLLGKHALYLTWIHKQVSDAMEIVMSFR